MVALKSQRILTIFVLQLLIIHLFCNSLSTHGHSTSIDHVGLLRKSRAIITRALNRGLCGLQNYTGKIRGGLITELDEFPWNVLLMYEKTGGVIEHGCGGVLIESNYVLTAAHCVTNQNIDRKGMLRYVRLGEYNTDTDMDCIQEEGGLDCAEQPMDMEVEKVIIHPEYSQSSWDKHHDIAIIKLKHEAIFSDFIQPICLPRSGMNLSTIASNLYVAGWGKTDLFFGILNTHIAESILSPIKLKLRVPLMTYEQCMTAFKQQMLNIGPGQLCAGGENERDSCPGDSGSPLMYFDEGINRWVVVGLVSMGLKECGMSGIPGVYTKIDMYLNWIENNMK